jgi:proton glutamate symport protein
VKRAPSLTTQIVIGLALGVAVGYFWPSLGVAVRPGADAFLRLIRMIIAPLVFSTLVVGIAGGGELKTMGRIGLKAIIYFEAATTVALVLGLVLANTFRPGAGLELSLGGDTNGVAALATNQQGVSDLLLHLIPTSVVDAMARGDILQVVVFSTLFGLALAALGGPGRPVVEFLDGLARVMFKITGYVMLCAPIGVFAAMASSIGSRGPAVLLSLGKLVIVMYAGLAIFLVLVVVGVSYLVRVSPSAFAAAVREPFLVAFTTASSEAALPKSFEIMERFGVPRNIVGFVLPIGYTFNLDGTTLYLSLASVFVAQLAGVTMTIGQQVVMILTLMLTSKGVAGVPRAALVVLTATLAQFNLPLEGAAILLGIDQILDMGRTSVNVVGNCMAAVVIARWEGVFDDDKLRTFSMQPRERAA